MCRHCRRAWKCKNCKYCTLGALTELSDVLKRESYENAIREMFASKPKVIDVNIEVLKAGAEWLKNNS